MLSKIRQKKQEGFTIIEVLIVLAIAGLILLVVFLAVPALQRNARNTQRSNDVAGLLGGMSEYVNNNNGRLPTAIVNRTQTSIEFGATSGSVNEVQVNLGFYSGNAATPAEVNITNSIPSSHPGQEGQVLIVTGAVCDGNSATSGSSRAYVALFTLENNAQQCRES